MGLYNFVLRYSKLAELKSNKIQIGNGESRGDNLPEDMVVTIVHLCQHNFITLIYHSHLTFPTL